ncbi:MAG: hypothetical protein K5790_08145, partial [Nitrosopumilus sp.]|nr:hypothetical protein [Nitrosopumilus sp.]
MRNILSIFIILFLITSIIPFSFADVQTDALTQSELIPISSLPPKETKNVSISLHESIEIKTNQPMKKDSMHSNLVNTSTSDSFEKKIYLSEKLKIDTGLFESTIFFNSINPQPQTILDRFFTNDKTKERKKDSKSNILSADKLINNFGNDVSEFLVTNSFIQINPFLILDNIYKPNIDTDFSLLPENLIDFTSNLFTSHYDLPNLSIPETNQQYFLIIFVPLILFLFLHSEGFEFNISKLHQPLSFVLILIILSTVVITPYSISSSYWPMAYAEQSVFDYNTSTPVDSTSSSSTPAEDTESTGVSPSTNPSSSENTSSSSTPAEDTENSEATTSDNTSTPVDSTSSSSTPAEDTESTGVSPSTNPSSSENTSSSSTP